MNLQLFTVLDIHLSPFMLGIFWFPQISHKRESFCNVMQSNMVLKRHYV